MADETKIEVSEPVEAAEKPSEPSSPVEALSGHPEGAVLESGEKVVGSYDDIGELIGWHKEPAKEK